MAVLLLSGCENPLDCLIDDRPVLNLASLEQPVLNQEFNASIGVSIKNDVLDDSYRYTWTLSGTLPPGISYRTDHRDLIFSGTATALGTYPYRVNVHVSDRYNWSDPDEGRASNLCRQSVDRNLSMEVAPL